LRNHKSITLVPELIEIRFNFQLIELIVTCRLDVLHEASPRSVRTVQFSFRGMDCNATSLLLHASVVTTFFFERQATFVFKSL
jgi:hypothetical protein